MLFVHQTRIQVMADNLLAALYLFLIDNSSNCIVCIYYPDDVKVFTA